MNSFFSNPHTKENLNHITTNSRLMKKQSKIPLTKEKFKKLYKKLHGEEKNARTADFKTRKKNISHQIDLLEKNVTKGDEDKILKTKKMLGALMLDLILEDFLNKEYGLPSQKQMEMAFAIYRKTGTPLPVRRRTSLN